MAIMNLERNVYRKEYQRTGIKESYKFTRSDIGKCGNYTGFAMLHNEQLRKNSNRLSDG
jgi:hypothetical protein